MIAPARMKSGIASSGKASRRCTSRSPRRPGRIGPSFISDDGDRRSASATAIGTLMSEPEQHRDHDQDQHDLSALSSTAVVPAIGHVAPAPDALARSRSGEAQASSQTMNSAAQIGITDCVTRHRHPRQADQRPRRQGRRALAARPRRAARRTRSPQLRRPRHREPTQSAGSLHHHAVEADVRALQRRQRRAVEREPGEQDRGDLVVPDERMPNVRKHDRQP